MLFFKAAANPVKSLKLQIWDFKFHDQKVQNWKFLVVSARRRQRQDFITFLVVENQAFNVYTWRTVKSNPI